MSVLYHNFVKAGQNLHICVSSHYLRVFLKDLIRNLVHAGWAGMCVDGNFSYLSYIRRHTRTLSVHYNCPTVYRL